jgi:c-di-GMP-binding flagellar brake protein YcgR
LALESAESIPDRRRERRRKIKVQRIFAAEILGISASQNCFLHIYDLSESGMRVHTDLSFPTGEALPLRLLLDKPIELRVEAMWQKELIGGMHVAGLKFLDVAVEAQQEIRDFLERHSPENKRKSVRLQRILVVEMVVGSTSQKFGVFTLDISTTGMKIAHDYPLPEDVDIPFRILLEYDKPPIEVSARVTWQEANTLGQYIIGLNFAPLDNGVTARLEDFIDHQLSGAKPSRRMATLSDFEEV